MLFGMAWGRGMISACCSVVDAHVCGRQSGVLTSWCVDVLQLRIFAYGLDRVTVVGDHCVVGR